jgi:hypothetical protein
LPRNIASASNPVVFKEGCYNKLKAFPKLISVAVGEEWKDIKYVFNCVISKKVI